MPRGNEVRLDLSGIDRLIDALPERARRLVRELGEEVVGGTKLRAPVDTGRLRADYHAEQVDDLTVDVGTNVEYGVHQEFGTSKMAAQPHLTPALEEVRRTVPGRVARLFR